MGCSVGFIYAKNALAAWAPPWTPLAGGAQDAPTDLLTSYSGADGRGYNNFE